MLWAKEVRCHLRSESHCIVLIPICDHELPQDLLEENDLVSCPGAGHSVDLRMALYARTSFNIFRGRKSSLFFSILNDKPGLLFEGAETRDVGECRRQLPVSLSDDETGHELRWIAGAIAAVTHCSPTATQNQITVTLEEAYEIAVRLYQYEPKKMNKVISILHGILQKNPRHADARAMLAIIAHQFRKHEQAVSILEESLQLNDTDPAYYFNLGNAYFAMDRYDEALAAFERAVALDETLFEAYDVMGKIYRGRKDYENELACHKRSFAIHGKAVWTKAYIAECLFSLGKVNEAVTCIQSSIDKFLYISENDRASAVMIWPWCARLYRPREAKFMLDRYTAP